MYLFLTPSKTDGGVNSQQGAPTTCNLTYWEVSQQPYVQTLLASLGVVKGQNSALKWRGGGGVDRKWELALERNSPLQLGGTPFWQIAHYSYQIKTSNPFRHPELSIFHQPFPSKEI